MSSLNHRSGPPYDPHLADSVGSSLTPEHALQPRTRAPRIDNHPLLLCSVILLLSAGMMFYSTTVGFVWDEGFHLLAAQLMNKGRRPYIDFCFPQTLLNAYWNAALMRWTGLGWRITHVAATLACVGAAALSVDYVFRRQEGRWRFPAALLAGLAVFTNQTFWKFGTCGQAYGLGTFFSVCAFRAAIPAIAGASVWLAALGGFFAGAAAGSTLLTAPVVPIILVWIVFYTYAGNRWHKAAAYLGGAAVPFFPMLLLFWQAPRQTLFNIVEYQALFRRVNWQGATAHDFQVLTAWLSDSAVFVMGILAIVGLVRARRWSGTSVNRRAELYLCAGLALSLIAYISATHPTFERYFVFAIPFLAILAAVGFVELFYHLGLGAVPRWPTLALTALLLLSLSRNLFVDRDATTWQNYVKVAEKIRAVTPDNGPFYADEHVYFLLNRVPPPGMEFSYARKLDLPAAEEKLYHIRSQREWTRDVQAGLFKTVETCKDEIVDEMRLPELFQNEQDFGDCSVYWGPIRPLKPKTQTQ